MSVESVLFKDVIRPSQIKYMSLVETIIKLFKLVETIIKLFKAFFVEI
jgi:hypothetical protein